MGIEEYRFLDKTMREISSLSDKLGKVRQNLSETEQECERLREKREERVVTHEESTQILREKEERVSIDGAVAKSAIAKVVGEIESLYPEVPPEGRRNAEGVMFYSRLAYLEQLKEPKDPENNVDFVDLLVAFMTLIFSMFALVVIVLVVVGPIEVWVCDDGDLVSATRVGDGNEDCPDGSDELFSNSGFGEDARKDEARLDALMCGALPIPVLYLIWVVGDRKKSFESNLSRYRELVPLLEEWKQSWSHSEDYDSFLDAKAKSNNLGEVIEHLDSQIEDLVVIESSRKEEVIMLEQEIENLWGSIGHLIPFSSSLEKA